MPCGYVKVYFAAMTRRWRGGVARRRRRGRARVSVAPAPPPTRVSDPDNLPPPRVHHFSQIQAVVRRARVARALDEV